MIKRLTRFVVLLTVFCLLGCGCSTKDPESLLVGKWELISGETQNKSMTLYDDGTCIIGDESGTWGVNGSELRIMGGFSGKFWDHDNYARTYTLEGDILTIDYYDGIVYKRVD